MWHEDTQIATKCSNKNKNKNKNDYLLCNKSAQYIYM